MIYDLLKLAFDLQREDNPLGDQLHKIAVELQAERKDLVVSLRCFRAKYPNDNGPIALKADKVIRNTEAN